MAFDDIIINNPEEGREWRERRGTKGKLHRRRTRYWMYRGFPEQCASFVASLGIRSYPTHRKDKTAKRQIEGLLESWEDIIQDFQKRGMTKAQAIKAALRELKEENERLGREPYNVFTIKYL